MMLTGIRLAAEKSMETIVKASEVAELGAVKPDGFGSLIKGRFPSEIVKPRIDEAYLTEFPQLSMGSNLFGIQEANENPYLSLRYNEVAKECSEYLCDYDITPSVWQEAALEQKLDMLKTASRIMANELRIPEEWAKAIAPVAVSGRPYKAAASCKVGRLDNGGVCIKDMPVLYVNIDGLTNDYFEAMATVYHEMIHIKQYASVDCVAPVSTTDARLLDLISEMKARRGEYISHVSYLYSPYEAEAYAQDAYFKKMLQAVIRERNTIQFPDTVKHFNAERFQNSLKETNTRRELTEEEKQYLRENTSLSETAIENIWVDAEGNYHLQCRNEELAGKNHEVTGVKYVEKTITVDGVDITVVVPEFSAAFECEIPAELWEMGDREIFKKCTEQLRDYLAEHPEMKAQFNEQQLEQIMNGEPYITGYTWHHSEVPGKMQLVEKKTHVMSGHTGGNSIWCGGIR